MLITAVLKWTAAIEAQLSGYPEDSAGQPTGEGVSCRRIGAPPGRPVLGRRRRCVGLSRKWSAIVHRLYRIRGSVFPVFAMDTGAFFPARSMAFLFSGPLSHQLPGMKKTA